MSAIYLHGSINLASQEDLQREAERFAANGWELRDPTTHKVSISIAQRDIDAFCDYLRSRPLDQKSKVWRRDSDGNEHQDPSITFYLNGSEITGTWIRLRSRLRTDAAPAPASAPAGASQPARAARPATPAPVRRAASPAAQPARPESQTTWQSPAGEGDEDDIPF